MFILEQNTSLDPVKPINDDYKSRVARNPNFDMKMGKEIGRGDRGAVVQAKNDPKVVMKVPMGEVDSDYGKGKDGLANIKPGEVEALHKLRRHRHVPNIENIDVEHKFKNGDMVAKLAMQKMPGKPIDFNENDNSLNVWKNSHPKAVRDYWNGIADIHRDGVAHGDIHWGNVLHDQETDNISWLDFGESEIGYDRAYKEAIQNWKELGNTIATKEEQKIYEALFENLLETEDDVSFEDKLNKFYNGFGKSLDQDD